MAVLSEREIDWQVADLNGELFAAPPSKLTIGGSWHPTDAEVAALAAGLVSGRHDDEEPVASDHVARELGLGASAASSAGAAGAELTDRAPAAPTDDEARAVESATSAAPIAELAARPPERVVVESISPVAMDSDVLLPSAAPSPPLQVAEPRPPRGRNALWGGAAAVMSMLALGLVVKVALDPIAGGTAAPAATAPAVARAVAEAKAVAPAAVVAPLVAEPTPDAPRPMITLDPVLITAPQGRAASADRAASPTPARASIAAVAAPVDDTRAAPSGLAALAPARTEISRSAAAVALAVAGRRGGGCLPAGDARTTMPVSVTFAPSGRVTSATVDGGPFVGTEVGGCVARALRGATVAPFDGGPTTVHATVHVR